MTSDTRVTARVTSEPASALSQSDVVIDAIKGLIVSGQLSPGARLTREKDLAAELNVSRGSLREGVRALCIMGVLETRQGDGTYVTSLDSSRLLAPMAFLVDLGSQVDAIQLQAVRRVLESEAASRAAHLIDDAALEEAGAILAAVEPLISATSDDHFGSFLEADIAFHRVIARASGNPALEALIEALATRTVRARLWRAMTEQGSLISTHREHLAILRAVASRDRDASRIRMDAHLLTVEEFMRDHPAGF